MGCAFQIRQFIKAANLNYEVGQAVDDVIIMNNRPKDLTGVLN